MDEKLSPRILPLDIEAEMKRSFISYAMAVIVDRALPDVRDGLKPVHRRILYSMDEQGFTADKPFHKSARIVGDVLGKYHPHGDSSVYDAMVRLAQDFNTRYMLVEGQGNFGSVDGDSAAAMRYTEARLSKLSDEMMADIGKNTVDFYPNFDETLMQPTVLPSRYPNLLVNGSGGIAVGMATNIPPHNLGEVIDAYVAMIDNRDVTVEELMAYIPGPDFPTAGIIMGNAGIRQAYRTGRGKVIVRAKAEIEEMGGGRSRIVVTEIPYQVNKARLVEKIAELVHDRRIEGISALRDETDRHGMRIVVELKRDVNANVILNQLYKHTQMQDTFGVIMLCLVDGEPKVLNLREMLHHYLRFQQQVVTRRTQYDLDRARERLHILEGLLIALDNIDEVVDIIKRSESVPAAKAALCARFGLSEKQAQAILDMRLARLTGLEREKILAERDELKKIVDYYESVLADESKLLAVIRGEILEIRRKFADERRTAIEPASDDIDLDDIIQEEDMAVTMTHLGYVKRVSPDTYKAQNRGGKGVIGQATREEDFVEHLFVTSTHNNIMFFTNTGRAFKIKCYNLPEAGRTAKGMAIVNLLQLAGGEKITAMFPVSREEEGEYLVLATRLGVIKKTPMSDFDNMRKTGIIALGLREGDELIGVMLSRGNDEFLVGTKNGKCIRFHEDDVRAMGRTATGVRSILLDGDDEVVDVNRIETGATVLSITEGGMGKRTPEEQYPVQGRGGKGVIAMAITEKTGPLACMKICRGDEDVLMIRDDGTVIRVPVEQISIISRNTQGVRLMRVDDETRLAGVALLPREESFSEEKDSDK
ncbi:MAG: DNA gyrase subunit A [Firmicutes bacterium ADurb.Bin248]|nr:MAG: DNA gyrase subunit A [Firmicutes bacterium ADurb.Bin248]HOG00908.1 DNA gyrase subunit A [Clostridia bacterium]